MSNPAALVGVILFAWFPSDEHPNRPGPKFRPVLVVDADPSGSQLRLAYGTSQRVDENYRGELTFRSHEMEKLDKDTKFCLGRTRWVPVTPEYFVKDGNQVIIGTIPKNRVRDLYLRVQEVL
ncbi:toxin of addiction system [Shewanella oncorhynchi]|uniref:toxin of addiction system n=1 Tax=Shewanella TaxID=22 RepID=UPI0039B0EE19